MTYRRISLTIESSPYRSILRLRHKIIHIHTHRVSERGESVHPLSHIPKWKRTLYKVDDIDNK